MDAVEADNLRHKEEERRRREKRKQKRSGSKSEHQREKEAKRRKHTLAVLNKVKAQKDKHHQTNKNLESSDESKFQALFSKRSEGFILEFKFRNAPPRPPVGPCFVGHNLEGEITRWGRYRENTIEKTYVNKLHAEPDLGIPLAMHSMILDNYKDLTQTKKNLPLHPDDEALLSWKGTMGDTAKEAIQVSRDRRRAEAHAEALTPSSSQKTSTSNTTTGKAIIRRVKPGLPNSRVLEGHQSWMKKTTYLYNDPNNSVHKFTSLADTKKKTAQQVEEEVIKRKAKLSNPNQIAKGFNKKPLLKHPTKKNVTAVSEYTLLPNVETWGHSYVHVVLDKPPKPTNNKKVGNQQLNSAVITDIRDPDGKSYECNLLVPNTSPTGSYSITQKYDLDLIQLRDGENPPTNFLLFFDDTKNIATYHPIYSRVQLSTGRTPSESAPLTYIQKNPMTQDHIKELEKSVAEVDSDLASKYDL